MTTDLVKSNTPEEVELEKKKTELERLSDILAEKELNLEELKISVMHFQHRYYSEVGCKYAELDEILAQIAELKASKEPHNEELNEDATKARTQANEAADEYESIVSEPVEEPLNAEDAENAKKLYRKIALLIHPDKATDEKSRLLRTRLMAELNAAYTRKDIPKIKDIVNQWNDCPESVSGDGIVFELIKSIRAIAQVEKRLANIELEIIEVMNSDVYILMNKVNDADLTDRDILAEMGISIDLNIQKAQDELAKYKG